MICIQVLRAAGGSGPDLREGVRPAAGQRESRLRYTAHPRGSGQLSFYFPHAIALFFIPFTYIWFYGYGLEFFSGFDFFFFFKCGSESCAELTTERSSYIICHLTQYNGHSVAQFIS